MIITFSIPYTGCQYPAIDALPALFPEPPEGETCPDPQQGLMPESHEMAK